jgi:hypothetical protein
LDDDAQVGFWIQQSDCMWSGGVRLSKQGIAEAFVMKALRISKLTSKDHDA